jgi:hypothetical protein
MAIGIELTRQWALTSAVRSEIRAGQTDRSLTLITGEQKSALWNES